MHQNWDENVISTDLVHVVQDAYVPDGIVLPESESESHYELSPLTPWRHRKVVSRGRRRQPSRESKKLINCEGTFVLFGKQTSMSEENTSSILESYYVYLSSLNLNRQDFTSIPEIRSLKR